MSRRRIIIMGAAGRDFHNFNTLYRDNKGYEVVAFTATQIPDIEGRRYPESLAGKLYPEGIPIYDEKELMSLIKNHKIDEVVFSYSDVSLEYVMARGSEVIAVGAAFSVAGGAPTMIKSKKPVVAVCAARTGSGKSQTTRRVCRILQEMGKKVVVIRHPMPYGDLARQACQRFADYADLDKHRCTIEEREEYEPHIDCGITVYAGVDYETIIRKAEKEADVVVWDGGNNDMSFYKADVYITVVDPHRPGHELTYYPGLTNVLLADIVIINKIDSAHPEDVETVRANVRMVNPEAVIVDAVSPLDVDDPAAITGKKVLAVEDGPTLTHGGMTYGAGVVAAEKYGCAELVDPRPYTVGAIAETFEKYPDIGLLLPAMGYSGQQVKDLEKTINTAECDLVVIGTPIDLRRIIKIKKPVVRVKYSLQEIGHPDLTDLLADKFKTQGRKKK
jgi:predicted GTPase